MRSLLIAISGMTVLYSFSDGEGKQWFVEQCAATGQGVWVEGKLWALVFSPLLHQSLFNLVFSGFVLWQFGAVLERWWGSKRFLFFVIVTGVGATAVGTLLDSFVMQGVPIIGMSSILCGCLAAYGVLFAEQPISLFGVMPLTGKKFAVGFVVLLSVSALSSGRWSDLAAYCFAVGFAWFLTKRSTKRRTKKQHNTVYWN